MEPMAAIYELAKEKGIDPENVWIFLKENQVRKQFASLGYKTVAFETGFEFTNWEDADLFLSRKNMPNGVQWLTPFKSILVDSTLAYVFTDLETSAYRNKFPELAHPKSSFISTELFKFSELPKIAEINGPTFAFVHILIPHYPYVFSPNGILTDPGYFSNVNEQAPINAAYFKDGYIKEIQFANQQLIPILTTILKKSTPPPVIVIQADHTMRDWGENREAILNAYYLPGPGEGKVYPTISPVNTFRLIFDTYFDGSYDLLPDESYLNNWNDPPSPEYGPGCRK